MQSCGTGPPPGWVGGLSFFYLFFVLGGACMLSQLFAGIRVSGREAVSAGHRDTDHRRERCPARTWGRVHVLCKASGKSQRQLERQLIPSPDETRGGQTKDEKRQKPDPPDSAPEATSLQPKVLPWSPPRVRRLSWDPNRMLLVPTQTGGGADDWLRPHSGAAINFTSRRLRSRTH